MALSDPQSITISGTTYSLPKINSGNNSSTYANVDGDIRLTASSAYGKRTRRVLRLDHDVLAPDPLGSFMVKQSMSNYIVFDTPGYGFTHDEILANWVGLRTLAAASSDSIVSKILGGEN